MSPQVGHLPCITTECKTSLDSLTGADSFLGWEDILGRPDMGEAMVGMPHDVIEKHLETNRDFV